MGYANRLVTIDCQDLVEEGEECWVIIRNPRTLPGEDLRPPEIKPGPDGEYDPADMTMSANTVIARLIQSWHVYDATADENAPLLGDPTPETVAKLPVAIVSRIGKELAEATNPQ